MMSKVGFINTFVLFQDISDHVGVSGVDWRVMVTGVSRVRCSELRLPQNCSRLHTPASPLPHCNIALSRHAVTRVKILSKYENRAKTRHLGS